MKQYYKILILILTLLSLSFFLLSLKLSYQNLQLRQEISNLESQPTLHPTSTVIATPTEKWKSYTNTEIGYSLNYPNDWDTVQLPEDSTYNEYTNWTIFKIKNESVKPDEILRLWKDVNALNPSGFHIIVLNAPFPDYQIQTTKTICEECVSRFSRNIISIDGEPANEVVASFPNPTQLPGIEETSKPYTYIILNHNNLGWVLAYPHSDFYGNHEGIYDQILSTFRFLD